MVPSNTPGDGYVRVPIAALASIEMRHVFSEIDLSIAIPEEIPAECQGDAITGYTEWTGVWHGSTLSLGWDWIVLKNEPVLLNRAEIRTNILVVESVAQALSPAASRAHLAQWIETIPWRQAVIVAALRESN